MSKKALSPRNPKPIDKYVGERIRALRELMGMTQVGLAQRVDVGFQQIQKYESGANRVSASRLVIIAKALGVPLTELFGKYAEVADTVGLDDAVWRRRGIADFVKLVMNLSPDDRATVIKIVKSLPGNRRGRGRR